MVFCLELHAEVHLHVAGVKTYLKIMMNLTAWNVLLSHGYFNQFCCSSVISCPELGKHDWVWHFSLNVCVRYKNLPCLNAGHPR